MNFFLQRYSLPVSIILGLFLGFTLQVNWIYENCLSENSQIFSLKLLNPTTRACEQNLLRLILGPLLGAIFIHLFVSLLTRAFTGLPIKSSITSHSNLIKPKVVKLTFTFLGFGLFYFMPNMGSFIIALVFILFLACFYFLFYEENKKFYIKAKILLQKYKITFLLPEPLSLKIIFFSLFIFYFLELWSSIIVPGPYIFALQIPLFLLILNILIITFLFVNILLVFRNIISVLIALTSFLFLCFTYHSFKLIHWDTPIEIYDIYLLPQLIPFLLDVGKNFLPMACSIAGVFTLLIGFAVYWRKKSKQAIHWKLFITFYIIIYGITALPFLSKDFSKLINGQFSNSFFYSRQPREFGVLYFLFNQFLYEWHLSPPGQYSLQTIEDIYQRRGTNSGYNTSKDMKEPVNLIIYMGEAFWDPYAIKNLEIEPDPLPFFHKIRKEGIYGDIVVPVIGGGTTQTEFEVLTGLSTRFISGIAYLKDIKTPLPALPNFLKSYGYKTLFIHNYAPLLYNRKNVLPLLGFERSIFEDEFAQIRLAGNFIKDTILIEEVIQNMAQLPRPFFIHAAGMVSHRPFTNYAPNSYAIVGEYNKESTNEFQVNMNLLHEVDLALKKLITYIAAKKEKIIVMFFGDHQPSLAGHMSYLRTPGVEGQSQKYTTPFLIWANFPIPKKRISTSCNFLLPLILDLLPLEKSAYYKIIGAISKEIPVFSKNFIKSGGNFVADENFLTEEEKKAVKDYRMLQYDVLHGEQFITSYK